ncbi:MAG: hypothetical protein U1D30_23025 [Planctomycetota bacterium]
MSYRRRYSRFRPDVPEVWIKTPAGTKIRAEVANESYGGLGLVCEVPEGLEEGLEVTVAVEDGIYEAVVVSLRLQTDQLTFVGLKWIGEEEEEDEHFDDFDEDEE